MSSVKEGLEPMSGDSIITHPDVAWDTTIVVGRDLDEVWNGPFGITRMGLVEEGGAGLGFPERLDPLLPQKFKSLPDGAPLSHQLSVNESIPDGHKDDRAVVREVVYSGSERTIVFETQWSSTERRSKKMAAGIAGGLAARYLTKESPRRVVRVFAPAVGVLLGTAAQLQAESTRGEKDALHYTWQVTATEGEIPGTTQITARTRMENVKHPGLISKLGPRADRLAMKFIGEGLLRNPRG